ncbi:MAG: replication initiation protein [Bacteroidota bacterium]|nr:replication initiation protein [Bacteroidota bacterium]
MDKLSGRAKIDKSYGLINSRYSLSATQSKIVLSVLSLIRPTDKDFKEYIIPVSEFSFLTDQNNHQRLRAECKKLMRQVLDISQEDGGWLLTHWFSKVQYRKEDEAIVFRIEKDLMPYLLQMKDNFSSIYLIQVMKLSSEYAIRIYEMCNQYRKIGNRTVELEELHTLFQVPKSYKIYNNFKQKVLEVAKKEINDKTDLTIEFVEIKAGRKVTDIQFLIKSKKKIAQDESEMMGASLFEEQDIIPKHMTIDDFLAVPNQRNILINEKTYNINSIELVGRKFVIKTDREDIKMKHKNIKKLLEYLIKCNNAYKFN